MNPAPETLKLQPNVPVTIALAYAEGKFQPGGPRTYNGRTWNASDQLMFSLVDGRKWYCEPYVQERITAARIAPGASIEVEKVETVQGNRRTVEIQVRPLRSGARAGLNASAPVTTPPVAETYRTPQPTTPPVAPPPPPPLPPIAVNGAGETATDVYEQAFDRAIDVALRGVDRAKAKGLLITPAFEDVRSIAFSISGLGGRR